MQTTGRHPDDGVTFEAEKVFFDHLDWSIAQWREALAAKRIDGLELSAEVIAALETLLMECELLEHGGHASARRGEGLLPATPDVELPDSVTEGEWLTLHVVGRPGSSYELGRRLGIGGHSIVYQATQQTPFRQTVAVKIYYTGASENDSIESLRELQAVRRLDHPGVCRVLDGGITPWQQPFLVLEYVDGCPLDRFLQTHPASLAERLALFRELLEIVAYAHREGVVHRDLKPHNILVHAASGRLKLIDFSIAGVFDPDANSRTSHTARGYGTREYQSPEQAGLIDAAVNARSDVFSLGCIFFELLNGEKAFPRQFVAKEAPSGPQGDDLDRRLLVGLRRKMGNEASETRLRDLAAIVLRCLAEQPADRFGSVDEILAQLTAWQEGKPLARWRRIGRGSRRPRWSQAALWIAAVAVVSLAAMALRGPTVSSLPSPPVASTAVLPPPLAVAESIMLSVVGRAMDPILSTDTDEADQARRKLMAEITARIDAEPAGRWDAIGVQVVQLSYEAGLFDLCRSVAVHMQARLSGEPDSLETRAELMSYLLSQNMARGDTQQLIGEARALLEELRQADALRTPAGLTVLARFTHLLIEAGSEGRLEAATLLDPFLDDSDELAAADPHAAIELLLNAVYLRSREQQYEECLTIAALLRHDAALQGGFGAEQRVRLAMLEAGALRRLGKPEEAIAVLRKEVDGGAPLPRGRRSALLVDLAEIYEMHISDGLEESLAILLPLTTRQPPARVVDAHWTFLANLQAGRVLVRLKRFAEAEPHLEQAIDCLAAWPDAMPTDAPVWAHVWLAESFEGEGRRALAADEFEVAAGNLVALCDAGTLPESMRTGVGDRLAERISRLREPPVGDASAGEPDSRPE